VLSDMGLFSSAPDEEQQKACLAALAAAFPDVSERTRKQYAASHKFKPDKASKALGESEKWRAETLPRAPGPDGSDGAAAASLLFTHRGFDHHGRPVFLYYGSSFAPKKWDADAVMLGVVHTLEAGFAAADAKDPSNDGCCVIVFLMDGGTKLDMGLAKQFSRVVGAHYPGRAYKALIYPGTPLATRLWAVARLFFSSEIGEKVVLVKQKAEGRKTFEEHLPEESLSLVGIDTWDKVPWGSDPDRDGAPACDADAGAVAAAGPA